jgi:hypothetical protein
MVHLPARNLRQQIKSPEDRKAGLTGGERLNLRQPNIG